MLCSFAESLARPVEAVGEEAWALGKLEGSLPIAPGFVLTALAEETFYVTNNLPERLRALFERVNPRRVDEDAVEDACERAVAAFVGSFMLEDFIAQVYTACGNAGVSGPLHVRRPGVGAAEFGEGRRGLLLALKRLWAREWAFDAVLDRLDARGSIAVEARAAYVFAGAAGSEDPAASAVASRVLERPVRALSAAGRVNGVWWGSAP